MTSQSLRNHWCLTCSGPLNVPRGGGWTCGCGAAYAGPTISGGAIAPLALILLPLLPQLIDSALAIYDSIANHPTTPEASATVIRQYVSNIRAINAEIQRAPLPGDEPSPA